LVCSLVFDVLPSFASLPMAVYCCLRWAHGFGKTTPSIARVCGLMFTEAQFWCVHVYMGIWVVLYVGCPSIIPQVLPDFKLEMIDESAPGDDMERLAEIGWLSSAMRAFMGMEGQAAFKPKKGLLRLASFWWLMAMNHVLRLYTGKGLERFAGPTTASKVKMLLGEGSELAMQFKDPYHESNDEGKWLSLPGDQCSVTVAASSFLKHGLGLLVENIWDPSHRLHNDVRLAFSRAEVYEVVILLGVPLSVNYGPFLNSAWWRQAQSAAHEY
jgi:hypothetical protein